MPPLPITELTSRTREIFRLVVEGYLSSGQPVGSKALAGGGTLNLSPASIRSVLHDLEGLGLLAAPHTSAGRMPTEVGLRLFVDGMMQVAEPTVQERAAIERRMSEPGPIEAALAATSAVLSDLSACAGLVMVPRREPRLQHLQLVPLAPGRALAVMVGEDGAVENRVVDLPAIVRPGALEEVSNYISAHLGGRTLAEAAWAMRADIASGQSALDPASRDLVERGLAVWSEDATRRRACFEVHPDVQRLGIEGFEASRNPFVHRLLKYPDIGRIRVNLMRETLPGVGAQKRSARVQDFAGANVDDGAHEKNSFWGAVSLAARLPSGK